MKPSDTLTITRVAQYERCPRQWAYVNVAGLRIPPARIMVSGSAMDSALTRHHDERIRGLNGLRGTALTDFYVTELRRLTTELEPVGEDPDAEMDGRRLLPIYEHEVSPLIEPLAVQKEVSYVIAGRTYLGHIDLLRRSQDDRTVISDHKFVGQTPQRDKAAKSLQLRAYDLAVDDPGHRVELISLVRLKREPKVVVTPHVVTPLDRRELLVKYAQTAALVDTMIYPQCSPDSWQCSRDSCGFWSRCRGSPTGPEPIPGEVSYA